MRSKKLLLIILIVILLLTGCGRVTERSLNKDMLILNDKITTMMTELESEFIDDALLERIDKDIVKIGDKIADLEEYILTDELEERYNLVTDLYSRLVELRENGEF